MNINIFIKIARILASPRREHSSAAYEEHDSRLRAVLQRTEQSGITLNAANVKANTIHVTA